ncbi:MAG: 5-oxoprolinase subunit PxpB [Dethiosulfatibacter sp.]|nr:5-oxoprolinase subunit PxpB [Dethiosulfatibacter sp.]
MKIKPSGDRGILITLGDSINEETNIKITALAAEITDQHFAGIEDLIPSYTQLLIQYDPLIEDYETLCQTIRSLEHTVNDLSSDKQMIIRVPVLYGGDSGSDLSFVASYNHLTEEEVIRIHSSTAYLIHMIGFTPGFPYLGGLSERIRTPRLIEPRHRIKAGSVGIADNQTGIYPIDSPGGWQIIGHTPVELFNWKNTPPTLFKAGQYIKFQPVTNEEYTTICQEIRQGTFRIKVEEKDFDQMKVTE